MTRRHAADAAAAFKSAPTPLSRYRIGKPIWRRLCSGDDACGGAREKRGFLLACISHVYMHWAAVRYTLLRMLALVIAQSIHPHLVSGKGGFHFHCKSIHSVYRESLRVDAAVWPVEGRSNPVKENHPLSVHLPHKTSCKKGLQELRGRSNADP